MLNYQTYGRYRSRFSRQNRRRNDNLEQQAQAAFNNIIANTTSDKTVQLSEIAWLNPKRSISKGKVARSIEMAHLPTTGSFPSGWEMKEYNGGMKFQNGDTLMARITPCLENGKVAFVNFLEDDEIAFGSTEYITMTPKRQFAPEVLYFLVLKCVHLLINLYLHCFLANSYFALKLLPYRRFVS